FAPAWSQRARPIGDAALDCATTVSREAIQSSTSDSSQPTAPGLKRRRAGNAPRRSRRQRVVRDRPARAQTAATRRILFPATFVGFDALVVITVITMPVDGRHRKSERAGESSRP